MNEFKKGDIVKRKIVTKYITILLPNSLITEVLEGRNGNHIVIKNDRMMGSIRLSKYFVKASKREAFLYHILGPYISEEE